MLKVYLLYYLIKNLLLYYLIKCTIYLNLKQYFPREMSIIFAVRITQRGFISSFPHCPIMFHIRLAKLHFLSAIKFGNTFCISESIVAYRSASHGTIFRNASMYSQITSLLFDSLKSLANSI